MWDVLEVTHEGTDEVKRSKINALTREFEMFQMNPGENIQDMQKRFTYLINQLDDLGKDYSNEDLINKVLRCLRRDWQPKVTAIGETRDPCTMSLATLFGKLEEHELELSRLDQLEGVDKKKKGITLKATTPPPQEMEEEESNFDPTNTDDETVVLFAKRFNKFFKKRESSRRPSNFTSRKIFNKGEGSNQGSTCYECGKTGHMKMECPMNKSKNETQEKRFAKGKKGRRAYIALDGNEIESSDESESEIANLCLMVNHDEDDLLDEDEVKDSEHSNYSFD
jgi:hypothetical protein